MECKHCKKKLLTSDFSTTMRRRDHCLWICWACQHPKCSGEGCEARQPMARIGNYTCEKCLYPPCHICKTTPRPKWKSNMNTCHNMPEWVCPGCKDVCEKCRQAIPKLEKKTTNETMVLAFATCASILHVRLAEKRDLIRKKDIQR